MADAPSQSQLDHALQVQKKETPFVINGAQSTAIISSTLIGIGILTLPREVTGMAYESGWLSVVFGMVVAMAGIGLITVLEKRFVGETVVEYSVRLLGTKRRPWIGRLLSFPVLMGLVVFWVVMVSLIARGFGEVVVTSVLEKTPLEVSIAAMLILAMYLALSDVETVARVNQLLFPLILFPVLLIIAATFQEGRLNYLFPLFSVDVSSFWQSMLLTMLSYQGYEVMLYMGAHTQPDTGQMRRNLLGVAIPGFVYTLAVVAGVAVFGYEELQQLMWPTLELVKSTQVPGLILERVEALFLAVWVTAIFTTIGNLYFTAAKVVQSFFHLRSHRGVVLLMLPFVYLLAMQQENVQKVFERLKWTSYVGLFFSLIVPFFLCLLALVKRAGVREAPRFRRSGGEGEHGHPAQGHAHHKK